MSKHTPEPWALFEVGDGRQHLCPASESDKMSILTIAEEDGVTFACVYKDSDARRIVTCINACAGMTDPAAEIAELKRQRDELLVAMRQTLAMLRVTSHGPSAANKAEEMLHAAICSIGADHSPDAAKMVVQEGWQLVPVEPTIEMVQAATHSSVGFGTKAAYKAMLAAAPKPEVGAA